MTVVVSVKGFRASITGGVWSSNADGLARLLSTITLDGELNYEPDTDLRFAELVIQRFGGRILEKPSRPAVIQRDVDY